MRALLVAACVLAAAPAAARTKPPPFTGADAVALGAVVDGATLALADGRVLRLASIEPEGPDAKVVLQQLVAGKALTLRYAGAKTDREGRVVAELFAGNRWIERELVRRGLARVKGSADERVGLPQLLAVEAAARSARRGLWRQARYAVRDAKDATRDAGTWQIVEGTVAAVTSGSDGAWLDFVPEGSFAAHVPRAALQALRAAGIDLKALDGTRLRVRGFIDGTRHPTMEVAFPEQIEEP